jgi:hypothetical protein
MSPETPLIFSNFVNYHILDCSVISRHLPGHAIPTCGLAIMDRAGRLLLVLCSKLARLMFTAFQKHAGDTASSGLTLVTYPLVFTGHFTRGDASIQGYHAMMDHSSYASRLEPPLINMDKPGRYKVPRDSVYGCRDEVSVKGGVV